MPSCGQMSLDGSIHPHVVQNGNGFVVEFSCTLNEILWMARAPKEGKRGSRIEFSKQIWGRVKRSRSGVIYEKQESLVNAFKDPVVGRVVGKAQECIAGELNVPLNLLPALLRIPPVSGDRKRAI